ncbi:MAG: hypothetical protein RL653_3354 [Pseudomonadota bacterium]|jgi:hypothetical protein
MLPIQAMKLVTQDTGADGVESADLKTLRMASPWLDEAALGRYLAYQRAYVELLEQAVACTSGLLAEAHARALAQSQASLDEVGRLGSLCTDYAGRRGVERTLGERHGQLSSRNAATRATGGQPSARDLELERKLKEELSGPGALERLVARHGEAAVRLLQSREEEILALHRRQLAVHL